MIPALNLKEKEIGSMLPKELIKSDYSFNKMRKIAQGVSEDFNRDGDLVKETSLRHGKTQEV